MYDNHLNKHRMIRVILVIGIMLILALIHWFRLGSYLKGNMYMLYYSYASDIMLPFGAYFLLGMNDIDLPFLRKWYIKAGTVFVIMGLSEIMQYFGIYFFGSTFDLIDMVMFGIGVIMAAIVDKYIFERFVPYWKYESSKSKTSLDKP